MKSVVFLKQVKLKGGIIYNEGSVHQIALEGSNLVFIRQPDKPM